MRSTLHDPLLTPENKLWRAVLEQAYVDAESGCGRNPDAEIGDDSHEKRRARCYLRGDSKQDAASLTMVCEFAEIPADRVLSWARRNYPRPQGCSGSGLYAASQNSIAVGAADARQSVAALCEHASA
jgi:hypothetical protein